MNAMATDMCSETSREDQYDDFLDRVRGTFDISTAGNAPLFTTDAAGLFDLFLSELPDSIRAVHVCNACRHFVERFGGLATIAADGSTDSAVWPSQAPPMFHAATTALRKAVKRAKVTGVFLSSLPVWGTQYSDKSKKDIELDRGPWHHFAVTPPRGYIHASVLLNAGQKMAEKHEDYATLCRALGEFKREHLDQAVALLKADTLYRSEKVLGVAEWLQSLKRSREAAKGPARDNITWLAVAKAPAGFCHPRSSMIGTLLEDLEAGLQVEDVRRKFADKMHPLQYQRPQVAPAAGNIEEAEKVVAKLGIANSLKRRFARLEEVDAIWRPAEPKAENAKAGVFAHLTPKGERAKSGFVVPPTTMTWVKFRDTVLPNAQQIEFYAAPQPSSYCALVTAVDPEAPPIIQWDTPEKRNPVSWYLWNGGTMPANWRLDSATFHKVTAITLSPAHWYGRESKNHSNAIVLLLAGAKETRLNGGLALFPEVLKSELHGVRSTIEAFSRSGKLEGAEEATACGITFSSGNGERWGARLRVTGKDGMRAEYVLDRWD